MHLERTNATMISREILESLSDPSISLDPSSIRFRYVKWKGRSAGQDKRDQSVSSFHTLLCSLPEPLHHSIMQTVRSAKFDRPG